MATLTREVLNADGMTLTMYVAGFTNVGFGISGTWTGTVFFEQATIDNPNEWIPLSSTPFASGTAVSSTTATGNWFAVPGPNIGLVRARFSRTTGSVQAIIAASLDSSYQDAFLSSTTIANSSSATSGTNTLTQAAQANRAWKLTFLEVSFAGTGFGANAKITVYDGTVTGNVLFADWLTSPVGSVGTVQKINIPVGADGLPSLVNTPGNAMTIVLTNAGNTASIINSNFTSA